MNSRRPFDFPLLACVTFLMAFASALGSPPVTQNCLSWDKDALPILKRSCLGCHNNGSAMGNLANHDSAKARAEKIRVQLATGKMPMRGELTDSHRATLLAWASLGANSCP